MDPLPFEMARTLVVVLLLILKNWNVTVPGEKLSPLVPTSLKLLFEAFIQSNP